MHFITLRGYGVNTREVTVDMDKVNHFYQILYKEHSGTTLVMDNGAEISVSQSSWEILKILEVSDGSIRNIEDIGGK